MQSIYGSCRKKRELVLCSRILSRARANTNKINKCVPKWAGEKSHQRKPRKGKNNIRSEPITTLNTAEINALTDLELDVEKQLGFSEYWHNEEKFYLHQILDDECTRGKR